MSIHDPALDPQTLTKLADAVGKMGYEIVDIAGFFDLIEEQAQSQTGALSRLNEQSEIVGGSSKNVCAAAEDLSAAMDQSRRIVSETTKRLRDADKSSNDVASWVRDLSARSASLSDTLNAVKTNNQQIVSIAKQVNTLAINAKIEAARAGDAGRGFSVVADAINELSQKTGSAATQISSNVETLAAWIETLSEQAASVSKNAEHVLAQSSKNETDLSEMEQSISAAHEQSVKIAEETTTMIQSIDGFGPSLHGISSAISETTTGIEDAHSRINSLIDRSEVIVQTSAALGAVGSDAMFIEYAQSAAARISTLFDQAIADGRISKSDMFATSYQPIPGTDPEQVMAPFTKLTDVLLPDIQEPAAQMDERVVFCAAVDRNGYLPTHNLKFSQPQGNDPVWNTAHCRNRRIFNDRVGLKAGQNTAPFLVQVYRRDMGGGEFAMMKDISAPIYVAGAHWGGLRLAVAF